MGPVQTEVHWKMLANSAKISLTSYLIVGLERMLLRKRMPEEIKVNDNDNNNNKHCAMSRTYFHLKESPSIVHT